MITRSAVAGRDGGALRRQGRARLACSVAVAFLSAAVATPTLARGPIACFKEGPLAPGAEQAVAEIAAAQTSGPQPAFADARWQVTATNGSTGVEGDAVVVTWGIAQDGSGIGAAFDQYGEVPGPSDLVATLDGWFGRETWMALFHESFDSWTALTGIEFRYEPNDDGRGIPAISPTAPGVVGTRPDIRIGGHPIDGDFGVVAYAYPPDDGDIVLDTTDPLFYRNTSQGHRKLRNTIMHEIGHSMGLEHVCPETATKLMEPLIVLDFDGPQHDDLIAMQSIYGDAREDDDDDLEAIDLGLGPGELANREELSIDGPSDEDWIAIPDASGLGVTVSVRPYGEAYSIADSNSSGSCSGVSPGFVNTLVSQDLAVEVLGADGTSVLASSDVAAAGAEEAVSGVAVEGGGFVRVVGDGGSAVQIYDMTVQYVPEPSLGAAASAGLMTAGLLARRRSRTA